MSTPSLAALTKKMRVGIVGGSGYGGAELLRLLLDHPHAEVTYTSAFEHSGKSVAQVHPNLFQRTNLCFAPPPSPKAPLPELDCLFLALPHGESMELVAAVAPSLPVIDLGGDFRLQDPALYARTYGRTHCAPGLIGEFVYGLSEARGASLRETRRIANPGCFATATLLALRPLLASGLVQGRVVVDAKTGSSGSGAKPQAGTHHPDRAASLRAYKPFLHQHVPEILQELRRVAPTWQGPLIFQAHSAPLVRGLFVSLYAEMVRPAAYASVRAIFEEAYGGRPFVRLVDDLPDVHWVHASNYVDLGFAVAERELVVFAALDNLVKGAAGQAVQNFNLMFGFPETAGLTAVGGHPA